MVDIVYDYQVLKLTKEFYKAYPNPPYTEILEKKARPYLTTIVNIHSIGD